MINFLLFIIYFAFVFILAHWRCFFLLLYY